MSESERGSRGCFGLGSGRAALGSILLCAVVFLFCRPVSANGRITVMMTANTKGGFSLAAEGQAVNDPLLALARSVLAEKKKGADLVLDLGNAFYPGALSKFSSGSITMDFLDFFGFDATLVSSADLHIGIKNLEFLQRYKHTRLLSANIVRHDGPVFTPWFEADIRGMRVAFVGISSKTINFDIAEKELYGASINDARETLGGALKEIHAAGIQHVFLLSGLSLGGTMDLIEAFPEIDVTLCGGDYTGELYAGRASRIDLADGRSILIASDSADYYMLDLAVHDGGISVRNMEARKAEAPATGDYRYQDFKARLALWRTKFLEEEDRHIAKSGAGEEGIDDGRLCRLLQDRFDSEAAVVEKGTLHALPPIDEIRHSDLLSLVNLDYTIFIFDLSGAQMRAVGSHAGGFVITGMERGEDFTIQGYALEPARRYRVAATQGAFEKVEGILGIQLPYRNSWLSVKELLAEDLQKRRVVLLSNYDYLDRRFRINVDAYLSNIIDSSSVRRDEDIATPVGQPVESYSKWGLENKIDIALYNKYHRFVLTPYMLYMRQDDNYIHNLLRGTLLYEYNLSQHYKPYNKLQYETVVSSVEGKRPSLLRETAGVSIFYTYFDAKLGMGFEKEVQDPSSDPLYGLELILGVRYPILKNLIYSFNLDTFSAVEGGETDTWQVRSNIENALAVPVNSHLSITLRHRYFHFYEAEFDRAYRNSQFLTTLDLKTGWKLW